LKTSHNILVVDDEQAHTMLISELLRKAGYAVASATDPFKALAAAKVRTPDLVVLDLHMPLMGGMDVFDRLRAQERTRHIPIIFLGGKDKVIPPFKLDEPNSEDVLFKPFEPNELLSRVRSLLKVKALRDELRRKEEQINELSLVDSLTNLKTPRYLEEYMRSGLKQARRYNLPLSVVVLEIDQLHEIVGAIGQTATDAIISNLAKLLNQQMRDSDIIVRTGLFEFTIVLPATNVQGCIEVAERLRNRIVMNDFHGAKQELAITVSLGICEFKREMDDEGRTLMSHARAALAQAHQSGGNLTLKAE
jgi:diguanylate cyclase (GGDEF)-like protein